MDAIDRWIGQLGGARVCEILEPLLTAERIARIDQVLAARLASVTVAVEDTYDPRNAAAGLRTVEALGLSEFHAIEPQYRFTAPKGITRGCQRWLDVHRWSSVADCATALRARGFLVLATAPGVATTLDDLDVSRPLALVFGNEREGLTEAGVRACDGAVAISMFGFTQSFNLSVSIALAMSKLTERRRGFLRRPGDLDPDTRGRLRARYFALKVRGAPGIIERAASG